jgi:aminodeoxyfutalosine deaminase
MPEPDTLFVASLVVPMIGEPIRSGGVLVRDGRILAVGSAARLARARPSARQIDLGRSVLLPGLINAHTHLELSGIPRSPDRPSSFTDWISALGQQLNRTAPDFEQRIARSTREGASECLRHGVTTVGDISQQTHFTRPILREGPLRVVSFGEALGLAGIRDRFERGLTRALNLADESAWLRCGLSPHAPYTVDEPGLRQCVAAAGEARRALCIHLAETRDEAEFTQSHAGAFRSLWENLGTWRGDVPLPGCTPIELAERTGLLRAGALLAHVNYCDDGSLDLLAHRPSSVVFCPRTHAYFDQPPHRWREMLARGVNVCLGTDSRASSPDLNIMEDVRMLASQTADAGAIELLSMITSRAAHALGLSDHGTLSSRHHADFVVFDHVGRDPLASLVHEPIPCRSTWIAGIQRYHAPADRTRRTWRGSRCRTSFARSDRGGFACTHRGCDTRRVSAWPSR